MADFGRNFPISHGGLMTTERVVTAQRSLLTAGHGRGSAAQALPRTEKPTIAHVLLRCGNDLSFLTRTGRSFVSPVLTCPFLLFGKAESY